jgi:hypothetical protein
VNLYVDTSVLLRVVLGEPGRLSEWGRSERWISSQLIRLEALRTIDRARVLSGLADREVSIRRAAVLEQLDAFDLVRIGPRVLERAAEPFPTSLGSLDAIHLASALLVRERYPEMVLATHDLELATAATAMGMRVLGAPPSEGPE